jgi:phosphate:Na+ symporter
VALILGDNIGTTITAELASIGATVNAKRAARAHTLFNVVGVTYILLLFPHFVRLIEHLTPGQADMVIETASQAAQYGSDIGDKPYIARHIANAHTTFNVVNNLVFLPLVGVLARVASVLVPKRGEEEVESRLSFLHSLIVETPSLALSEAGKETVRMAELSQKMFLTAMEAYEKEDLRLLEQVRKTEFAVDRFQKEIHDFLVPLSQQSITGEQAKEIGSLITMAHNFERIGDQSENLSNLIERKIEERVIFTDMAKGEFQQARTIAEEFLELVVDALKRDDRSIMDDAQRMEDDMDRLEKTLRENHIERLNAGVCTVNAGLIFMDMLHNLERIADQCLNIAEAVVGIK